MGILQPGYLPWLGFFEQMYRSDVFVIYDDVQYDKNGWRNRNRIKTTNGAMWLTIPVHAQFTEKTTICDVRIDNRSNWQKKHLASIKQNYYRAPFYQKYADIFERAYSMEWGYLIDVCMYFIYQIANCLGMEGKTIVRSSSLKVAGDRTQRLINICKILGGDTFYEGASGKNYIDETVFLSNGIKVEYQEYKHPVYSQLYGEFISHLSVIDLLFNHKDASMEIIKSGQEIVYG